MEEENLLARQVVDAAVEVHKLLGPGLLESAYEKALDFELRERGFTVDRQPLISISYKTLRIEEGFRADLIVNGKLLLELKSIEQLKPIHSKQVLTYLRLSGLRLGLLINFGSHLLKNGISRVANAMPEESPK